MPVSRNLAGTVFVGGAVTLTLTALAYPTMLGFQTASSGFFISLLEIRTSRSLSRTAPRTVDTKAA